VAWSRGDVSALNICIERRVRDGTLRGAANLAHRANAQGRRAIRGFRGVPSTSGGSLAVRASLSSPGVLCLGMRCSSWGRREVGSRLISGETHRQPAGAARQPSLLRCWTGNGGKRLTADSCFRVAWASVKPLLATISATMHGGWSAEAREHVDEANSAQAVGRCGWCRV
jgi:hypothetical protein